MSTKEYSGPAKGIWDEIVTLRSRRRPPWDEILSQCKKGLDLDPGFFPAHYYLGRYEMERGNHDGMEKHFLMALELADDPHNVITWDNVLCTLEDELEDYERLARYLKVFYAKLPEFFVLRDLTMVLGNILDERDEALEILDEHILLNPEDKKAQKHRKELVKNWAQRR